MQRQALGKFGESIAKKYLERLGYQILHQNWRYSRYGELDLIAYHKDKQLLSFIEVKTRSSESYGQPIEVINRVKQSKMRFLAEAYIANQAQDHPFKEVSLDVIAVTSNNSRFSVEHYKNAF